MVARTDACKSDHEDEPRADPVPPHSERRPLRACVRCGHDWYECGVPQEGIAFDRTDEGWRCRRCGSLIPYGW
jgi:DNA-directed RNA polymerase subunit RPC12/RpoP